MVQYNREQDYESIVLILGTALSIVAGIVVLQEPFIGTWEINDMAFNLY